jgi:hypothetical protein
LTGQIEITVAEPNRLGIIVNGGRLIEAAVEDSEAADAA